jgi:putative FmdB family regulatory protein
MPIYEYQCEHCGVFEEMQRITDAPLSRCPKCKRKVRRLISNTSFQLKGTGWYVTDYAGKKGGKDGGESKSETKSESSSETKTESKSTKAETKSGTSGTSTPATTTS